MKVKQAVNGLVVIAEGRLDVRGKELYLNNELLFNILAIYGDGDITICISKERDRRRREILEQILIKKEASDEGEEDG